MIVLLCVIAGFDLMVAVMPNTGCVHDYFYDNSSYSSETIDFKWIDR